MLLVVENDFGVYRIEGPAGCQVRLNADGSDFLLVPDPDDPAVPYRLCDDDLLDAACAEQFGLRMISIDSFN